MAQAAHPAHFIEARTVRSIAAATGRRLRRLYARFHDAQMEANRRKLERELARLVSTRGKFTDSVEREISNMLLGDGWKRRT
jgi:hypothetical protein